MIAALLSYIYSGILGPIITNMQYIPVPAYALKVHHMVYSNAVVRVGLECLGKLWPESLNERPVNNERSDVILIEQLPRATERGGSAVIPG